VRTVRAIFGFAAGVLALAACDARRPESAVRGARDNEARTGDHGAEITSLLAAADSILRQSPESARRVWRVALVRSQQAGDSTAIALSLTGLGQAALKLGDFTDSRRLGERALTLKLRLDLRRQLFRSYNALGLLAWREERLDDASDLFTKASAAARAVGDSVSANKAMLNSGLVAQDRGEFEKARQLIARARDVADAFHDTTTLARSLNNLAALDVKLGDAPSAIQSLDEARRIAKVIGDFETEVNARGQLATAFQLLGQPQRAFALLDSALSMATRDGRKQEQAEDLKLLADLFLDAGDNQHALDYYERARVLTDSLDQPEEWGTILRNEARVHMALDNLELAARRAGEARVVHARAGSTYAEISDLLTQAEIERRNGRLPQAAAQAREARVAAEKLRAPATVARAAVAQAQVAAARADWSTVLRLIDEHGSSIPLAGSDVEAESFALAARANAGLGRLQSALTSGRRAVAAVERVRANYTSGGLRTSYLSNQADVYAAQVILLLRTGRADEAFSVADAARGRALLEHLAAARADVRMAPGSGATAAFAQEQLLRRIDALVAQLQVGESHPPRERSASYASLTSALQDSIAVARAEYEALVARTSGAAPLTGASSLDPKRRPAIAAVLGAGEALLEYLATPERLIIFALTRDSLFVRSVDENAVNLAARVHLARDLLRRRETASASSVLTALYAKLVQPVADAGALKGVSRLVIVPHGPLAYLPFGALLDAASGRYVAEQFTLVRVPTAASLPALRDRARAAQRRDLQTSVFAPLPDSLPATRREAVEVGRRSSSARVFLGEQATKREVERALVAGDVVHVATHAAMNTRNPLFSHIELAPDSRTKDPGSGRLEVHELLGMRVASPLVFLSGCETGLGGAWSTRFDAGEDYTTLAQTLLYAGARDVVATLWRVDDASSATFAEHFYGALKVGDAADALTRAQRAMLSDAAYRSPYYWAAYEITGAGVRPGRANDAELSDKR